MDAESLAEVIRKSLAIYEFLFAQTKKGGRIIIKSSGGEQEVILLQAPIQNIYSIRV